LPRPSTKTRYRGAFVPAPALILAAVVPLVLAGLTLFDPSMLWVMLATDAAIVVVAIIDLLIAWKPVVTVSRHTPKVLSIGRPNPIRIRVRSRATRGLRVRVVDDVMDEAIVEDLPAEVDLPAGSVRSFEYHIVPTDRGEHQLGDHFVRYRSPLGLWNRQIQFPATSTIRVYPDVQLIRTYERLAGQDRGQSVIRTRSRQGGETEFEQLRDYVRGDPYRSVDWRATARRNKLVTRQYQLERDQNVFFALDAGRLMTAESAGLSLFDHALNATLMLAHVATKAGDRVGMFTFDQEVRSYVATASGGRAMQHLIHASYAIRPRLTASDFEHTMSWVAQRLRRRMLFVLFTHVADSAAAEELLRSVRQLRPRHLPLVVMFRDVDVEALAVPDAGAAQPWDAGAAAELLSWRSGIVSQLRAQGALVLDVRPTDLTIRLVNTYLEIKARHQL
jgi:uncharacterized protein (DUF58 family)